MMGPIIAATALHITYIRIVPLFTATTPLAPIGTQKQDNVNYSIDITKYKNA